MSDHSIRARYLRGECLPLGWPFNKPFNRAALAGQREEGDDMDYGQTSQIETITPDRAKVLLEASDGYRNRSVSRYYLDCYVRDMKAGAWTLDGAPIRVNPEGQVIDGQHRLMACVRAGVAFTTWVTYGVKAEDAVNIDTGKSRLVADKLTIFDHVPSARNATSILREYQRFSYQGGWLPAWRMSYTQAKNEIQRHPLLTAVCRSAMNAIEVRELYRGAVSTPGAVMLRIAELWNVEAAADFFLQVGGVGVEECTPVHALRRMLVRMPRTLGEVTKRERMALTVVAWNHHVQGRSRQVLRWDGVNFPLVLGPKRKRGGQE